MNRQETRRVARNVGTNVGPDQRHLHTGRGKESRAFEGGGERTDRFRPERLDLQDRDPARLLRERGLGARAELRIRWLVTGRGPATVRYEGEKVRTAERAFDLP